VKAAEKGPRKIFSVGFETLMIFFALHLSRLLVFLARLPLFSPLLIGTS